MSLKILCAGCSKDERAEIESGIRGRLRGVQDPWTVSLVKLGSGWSVTLDGPAARGKRGLSFSLPAGAGVEALGHAVRTAIAGGGASEDAPAPGAAAPVSLGVFGSEHREAHTCAICSQKFVLIYEAEPGEPLEEAPVACPHCWQVGRVQVPRSASIGRDYRADKL